MKLCSDLLSHFARYCSVRADSLKESLSTEATACVKKSQTLSVMKFDLYPYASLVISILVHLAIIWLKLPVYLTLRRLSEVLTGGAIDDPAT